MSDESELITLDADQQKAFTALEKAVRRCEKLDMQFYMVLESMYLLNGRKIEMVSDDPRDPGVYDVLDLSNDIINVGFAGFADDPHTVKLKGTNQ